ncbi:phage holin family protein [Candidatus Gracilibacteria bacterium]|nr:phage holin family protein [Candidatus Gracilibacteria bacterium]
MKIIISILFNALILYAITFFLPGITADGGLKLFFVGGVVLGMLNFFVKPFLKLFGLPFIIFTFGLFILVINGIILFLLEKIILILNIEGVSFSINGLNFVIAVAIFTIFNTIYNTFIKK